MGAATGAGGGVGAGSRAGAATKRAPHSPQNAPSTVAPQRAHVDMAGDCADPRWMRHALRRSSAPLFAAIVGCSASEPPLVPDARGEQDAIAAEAGAPCEETLAAWCARGGHVCVERFADAIAPGSPHCGAIFGALWADGGCPGFTYVIVADTVDQVLKYAYDASTGRLVAVMDQTTIIETCLAGAPGVAPPRGCDDPRNDPATCCRPTGGGPISCGFDAGTEIGDAKP